MSLAEFSRRQLIKLLEKAVLDRKLPDTLLFRFESFLSWPFTKEQEQILLSYATVDNLKKSAGESAGTVKTIKKMGTGEGIGYPSSSPSYSSCPSYSASIREQNYPSQTRTVHVQPTYVSYEPRYSRGEWERIQKSEADKAQAKVKVEKSLHGKDPVLSKFYRKIEVGG